jgi:putative hydrolase of the HAD superfamily
MGAMEKRLGLRAVVFDYGMVLTGPPDPAAHAELVRITGLAPDRFEAMYWADRQAYDEGKLTGWEFWRKLASDAGLAVAEPAIEELVAWDARMWSTENRAMIAWQSALKRRGVLTAIVSNMGGTVHEHIEREFKWLSQFDVCVWSYQLGVVKPDPAIYRYALDKLGTDAGETLFIDDRPANVEAALALGMKGLVFSTVEKLRADLAEAGWDAGLPLP